MRLNEHSIRKLNAVHPDLKRVAIRAASISKTPFVVTEGLRTPKRQRQLVEEGASRTMNSRHLTGHAIDIAPIIDGEVSWTWPPFHTVAEAFKEAARDLGVPIVWGGDWHSFKDGPHFELPRKDYP